MTEYPPDAMQSLFNAIKAKMPSALMGGIQGDAAHTYGYHRGRNYVSSSDYSVQYAEDKRGDGEACSALDISWNNAQDHYDASRRLLNAKNDPRMNGARSFFGSTDGVTVCGWDYKSNYAVSSDDSHLWHIHLSVLRENCTEWPGKLEAIADVITGTSGNGGTDDDMIYYTDKCDTDQPLSADYRTINTGEDGAVGWDMAGPCDFQVQANLVISGLASGEAVRARFFSLDHKDGQPNERAYTWPVILLYGSGTVVQFGRLSNPGSGRKRWLRLEAQSDASGVVVKQIIANAFHT